MTMGDEDGLIDVHHHFLPAEYRSALVESGNRSPDGIPAMPAWSVEEAVRVLDYAGIEMAFVSISSPGVLLEGFSEMELARLVNERSAELISTHPGRFGGFATLPLPNVDASLIETERALGELQLDGVVLLTHYGDTYLGDPALDRIFDELNQRGSVVFIHPTSPVCCAETSLGFPAPILEFMFDTTRAVTNLIYSGTVDRCPNIQWIVPHAGAALPALAARLAVMPMLTDRCQAREDFRWYLERFHYDLAGPRTDESLSELLQVASPSRLLYGSDWPFTPERAVNTLVDAIHHITAIDRDDAGRVLRANAQQILPRARAR